MHTENMLNIKKKRVWPKILSIQFCNFNIK